MLLPFTLVQRIRRVAIIAGVISLFTLYSNTGALGEGRRSNLEVFRYAATEAPDELTAFRRFEEAVSAKVLALNDELGQRIRLHSLSQLKLVMVQDAKGNQLGTT